MNILKTLSTKLTMFLFFIVFCLIIIILFNTSQNADATQNDLSYTYRKQKDSISEEDLRLLISITHSEANGDSYEAKLAIANVILNRLNSDDYPNTLSEIIFKSNDFKSTTNGALNKHLWEYDCGNFISDEHLETIRAVNNALKGTNNINNCIHFKQYWPKVKYTYKNQKIIDNHIFW